MSCTRCGEDHAETECPYGRVADGLLGQIIDNERLTARGPVHAIDETEVRVSLRTKSLQAELLRMKLAKERLEARVNQVLWALVAAFALGIAIAYGIQGLTGGVQ